MSLAAYEVRDTEKMATGDNGRKRSFGTGLLSFQKHWQARAVAHTCNPSYTGDHR
jgi:hypothetical protein